jgi:hypothetical protein
MRLHLEPKNGGFTTHKGHSVQGLILDNLAAWEGQKYNDGSFQLGSASEAAMVADFDGQRRYIELKPQNHISGQFFYGTVRIKQSTTDSVSNKLIIDAGFVSSHVEVSMHAVIWLADCRPKLNAWATCSAGIDGMSPYIAFQSDAFLLPNMASQDICNATRSAGDYTSMCTATGGEMPKFYCQEDASLGSLTPTQQAKRMTFTWTDANGKVFAEGTDPVYLNNKPQFPVALTAKNEWDRMIQAWVNAPGGSSCPPNRLDLYSWHAGTLSAGAGHRAITPSLPPGDYRIRITDGSGDADLYVRRNAKPTTSTWDCRPYLAGSDESCDIELGSKGDIQVLVQGASGSSGFNLTASWLGFDFSSTLASGQQKHYITPELPAGQYRFTLSGSGDADLYLRVGAQPDTSSFDCRPYESDSEEECVITITDPARLHAMVRGYAASSQYTLKASVDFIGMMVDLDPDGLPIDQTIDPALIEQCWN